MTSSFNERSPSSKFLLFCALHVLPLVLASTNFTIVTFLRHRGGLSWDYIDVSYRNGWGYVYKSDYSVPQVLTYLLAYGAGVFLYPRVTRPRWLAGCAVLLCAAGFISFAIELSHVAIDHNLSLLASFPAVLGLIALWTIGRRAFNNAGDHTAVERIQTEETSNLNQ